jgi:hypothetical protein
VNQVPAFRDPAQRRDCEGEEQKPDRPFTGLVGRRVDWFGAEVPGRKSNCNVEAGRDDAEENEKLEE